MDYSQLKEGLAQVLNEDLSNRNSIQDLRRSVFLSSENQQKNKELIQDRENLISSLNQELQNSKSTSGSLELEMEKLRAANAELLNTLKKAELTYQETLAKKEREFVEISSLEKDNFSHRIETLQVENKVLSEKIEQIKKDSELTSKNLSDSELKIQGLNLQIDSLQHEKKSLFSEMELKSNQYQIQIEGLNNEIKDLSEISVRYSKQNEETVKLVVERDHFASKIRELIYHIDEQGEQIVSLKNNLELEKSKFSRLDSESNLQKEQLDSLRESTAKHSEELNHLLEKSDLLQKQLEDSKSLIQAQNNEVLFLQQEKSKSDSILSERNFQIENFQIEIKALKDKLYELEAEKDLFLDKILTNEKQLEEYSSKLSEYNPEALRNEILQMSLDLDTKKEEILRSNEEIFSLKNKIVEYENSDLGDELEKIKADFEKLDLEFRKLSESEQNFIAELDHSSRIISELENQNREKEEMIDELNSSLIKMKEEFNSNTQTSLEFADSNDAFIEKLFAQINLLNDEKLKLNTERDGILLEMKQLKLRAEGISQNIENKGFSELQLEFLNKNDTLANESEIKTLSQEGVQSRIQELVEEIDECINLLSKGL